MYTAFTNTIYAKRYIYYNVLYMCLYFKDFTVGHATNQRAFVLYVCVIVSVENSNLIGSKKTEQQWRQQQQRTG